MLVAVAGQLTTIILITRDFVCLFVCLFEIPMLLLFDETAWMGSSRGQGVPERPAHSADRHRGAGVLGAGA